MRNVFDDFAVDMLPTSPRLRRTSSELHRSLCTTGGAHPSALAGEGDKERELAAIAIYPSGSMSEDAALEVLL
jgi:hypothetical protein